MFVDGKTEAGNQLCTCSRSRNHNHAAFLQALTVGTALVPLTHLTYLSLRAQTLSLDSTNPELHLPRSLQYLDLAGYM